MHPSWILSREFNPYLPPANYFERRRTKKERWGVRVIVPAVDEKVLLVQHSHDNQAPFYVFPGGGVELDETIPEAAMREVLEETHLTIEPLCLRYIRHVPTHPIEFYVLGRWQQGSLQLGTDPEVDHKQILTDATFVTLSRLLDDQFAMYPLFIRSRLATDLQEDWAEPHYVGAAL